MPEAPEIWGADGAPIFFILKPPPKAAVSRMGATGAPTGAPKAPLPWRAREIPPKAGVREYSIEYRLYHTVKTINIVVTV